MGLFRLNHFTISFLILTSLGLSLFSAECRRVAEIATDNSQTVNEEEAILRGQIGSRPPRCDRRCATCRHCEAIQVPTNPQKRSGTTNSSVGGGGAVVPVIAYARGDGSSNYKPMSWKCKCGNLIFSP